MSKTISREFWVSETSVNAIKAMDDKQDLNVYLSTNAFNKPHQKITISWEIPDRKIEITESEFDRAWESATALTWSGDRKEQLKEKLFGKSEE